MSSCSGDEDEATPLPYKESNRSSASSVDSDSDRRSGYGELHNTTSFARRLADGTPNKRDQIMTKLSQESGEMNDASEFDTSAKEGDEQDDAEVGSNIQRTVSTEGEGGVDAVASVKFSERNESLTDASPSVVTTSESDLVEDEDAPASAGNIKPASDEPEWFTSSQSTQTASAKTPPPPKVPPARAPNTEPPRQSQSGNQNENPFGAFGDYITMLFQKAEVLEEELEIRQSQRDLQARMDKTHHGSSRRKLPMSPEGRIGHSSSEESSHDGNLKDDVGEGETPKLSDSMEARAAVEAISSFRSLTEVKKQLSIVVDDEHREKKQKVEEREQSKPTEEVAVDESKKKEWKEQWDAFVVEKKKNKYNEVAIQSLSLPLSVDEFSHHVLEDNATHSFGKFMVDIGELKVNTTLWQPAPDPNTTEPSARVIQYTHPVNAPMAPPTAKARKQMSLHKFGSVGLCLETCTIVEEVPMADCFVVNDRLWVSEAEDGNEGCVVAVTFQIHFIKGTMFRRIIENTTRREYASFWNQFADMIQNLKGPVALEEEELEEVAIELEEATALLEAGGQEVPLASVLDRVRTSSRRLSHVLSLRMSKKMVQLDEVKEKPGVNLKIMLSAILDGVGYVRKEISENENGGFAVACTVIFFMALLNMLALKQMVTMNKFMYELGVRLEKANEINEALLLKLASSSEATCSS